MILKLVLLAALLFTTRAEACSCQVESGTHAELVRRAFADAGAVFIARVQRSTLMRDTRHPTMVSEDAWLEIVEVFKGELRKGQVVRVHQIVSSGTCGRSSTNNPPWMYRVETRDGEQKPVPLSKDWLVYAYGSEPYELNSCTRSSPLNVEGGRDIKLLRQLTRKARQRRG